MYWTRHLYTGLLDSWRVIVKLEPVKRKRVYQEIVEQIMLAINRNELKPGDKLPSERTLAQALSVSRTSVKEATSILESSGIVEVRPGIGVFLVKGGIEDTLSKLQAIVQGGDVNLVELMEMRQALEGDAAFYAARRGNVNDIQIIEDAFLSMEQAVKEGKVAAEEDFRFHMAIITSSKNNVMKRVMYLVSDSLLEGLSRTRRDTLEKGKSLEILEEHRGIYEAIKSGNAKLARERMWHHLQGVKERFY